jgi:hypothetical protein
VLVLGVGFLLAQTKTLDPLLGNPNALLNFSMSDLAGKERKSKVLCLAKRVQIQHSHDGIQQTSMFMMGELLFNKLINDGDDNILDFLKAHVR